MDLLKKLLKVGLAVALFGGVLVGVLLVYGKKSGEATVGEFFAQAERRSLREVQDLFHPALRKVVDPWLLAAFVKALPGKVGKFKSIDMNGMQFEDKLDAAGRKQHYQGTMTFEQRGLTMTLDFLDGLLVTIEVKDPVANELVAAIDRMPEDPADYAARGEAFWRAAMGPKPTDAFSMLWDDFQKQFGAEQFVRQFGLLSQQYGALQEIKFARVAPAERPDMAAVVYDCKFEKGSLSAHVKFWFVGLESRLVGFQAPSELAK